MPSENTTTTKFRVDISDLKKGIQDASRQIKLANAEFKAAASGMDNWEKSADGVSKKVEQLDKVLDNQKKILESYERQLDLIVAEYGENSKEADEMRIKIANQQAVVNKTTSELEKYQSVLKDLESEQAKSAQGAEKQAKAYDDLKDSIDGQQKELDDLKDEYKQVVIEQGKNSDVAKELAKEIDELSGELADNKKAMNEADKAADDLDHSLDDLDPEGKADGFTVLKGAIADLVSKGIQMAISAIKDFAAETIEVGKTFDKSMSNVAALSGATADELQMLRDTAKEYGSSTQFSASEAADALGYMALAGWNANQSASALGGVLDLAASSGMDLAAASDMVTDYMSAFNMSAEESAYFADLLAYAQANANTTAQGLGEAFKNSAANMNAAGQDIETTVSLLAMMANQGLKGSTAGTALSAVMRDITKNMDTAGYNMESFSKASLVAGHETLYLIDALNEVGVSNKEFNDALKESSGDVEVFMNELQKSAKKGADTNKVFSDLGWTMQDLDTVFGEIEKAQGNYNILIGDTEVSVTDANGNFRDMTDILMDVEAATEGMGDAEKAAALSATFTADSIKGLNLILNAGVKNSQKFEEELRDSSGAASEMAKVMNDNLAGDLTALHSKLEGVQLEIYEKFTPALRGGVEVLSNLLDGFSWILDHGNEVVAVLSVIATGIAAYVAYTTAIKIMEGGLMSLSVAQKAVAAAQWIMNAAMNANPIGILIALITALVSAFMILWNTSEDFRQFWIDLWDAMKTGAVEAWEGIKKTFGSVADWFTNVFKTAWEGVKAVFSTGDKIFDGIVDGIVDGFKTVVNAIIRGINKVVAMPFNAINKVLDKIKNVNILGVEPFKNIISTIDVPQIPELKNGGVLAKGQVGLLEGDGAEAVVPLENNKEWIAATAEELRRSLVAEGLINEFGGGAGGIGGTTYTFNQYNSSPKALDRLEIYRQTRNQLELAKGV